MSESAPDVSVVIPVYNGEDLLGDALDSVLWQSGVDFEVIVVDDGSADEAAVRAVVEARHDERVRLYRKENGGVSTALNLGSQRAQASVIVWLSHDDVMAPGRLAKQWSAFKAAPGGVILYGDYAVFEGSRLLGVIDAKPLKTDASGYASLTSGQLNGCTTMVPAAMLHSLGGFDEGLRCTQDYDLWIRAIEGGARLVHQPGVHVFTRVHTAQTSRVSEVFASENAALWRRMGEEVRGRLIRNPEVNGVAAAEAFRKLLASSGYLRQVGLEPEQQATGEALARYPILTKMAQIRLAVFQARRRIRQRILLREARSLAKSLPVHLEV